MNLTVKYQSTCNYSLYTKHILGSISVTSTQMIMNLTSIYQQIVLPRLYGGNNPSFCKICCLLKSLTGESLIFNDIRILSDQGEIRNSNNECIS